MTKNLFLLTNDEIALNKQRSQNEMTTSSRVLVCYYVSGQ